MAELLLFASIREAAGTNRASIAGVTVGDVLDESVALFGEAFAQLLPYCSVFLGDDRVSRSTILSESDEIAVLPPVSGG